MADTNGRSWYLKPYQYIQKASQSLYHIINVILIIKISYLFYIALVSALKQAYCALVACDSELNLLLGLNVLRSHAHIY